MVIVVAQGWGNCRTATCFEELEPRVYPGPAEVPYGGPPLRGLHSRRAPSLAAASTRAGHGNPEHLMDSLPPPMAPKPGPPIRISAGSFMACFLPRLFSAAPSACRPPWRYFGPLGRIRGVKNGLGRPGETLSSAAGLSADDRRPNEALSYTIWRTSLIAPAGPFF